MHENLRLHFPCVFARVAAYVRHPHVHAFAHPSLVLLEHHAELVAVDVAIDSPQRLEGSEPVCHLDCAYVAGVPHLVAVLEMLEDLVVQESMSVRKQCDFVQAANVVKNIRFTLYIRIQVTN